MDDREHIQLLEEQIENLNKEKRAILDALEISANLGNFRISLNRIEEPGIILRDTAVKIKQLLDFKALSFYLVDEDNSNFYQEYTDPPDASGFIENEVNYLIEDKTFSWALGRNKPVVVSSRDNNHRIILHSMTTSSRTRGIFVGMPLSPMTDITDLAIFLFSITIISCSHSLESFELYRQIRDRNKKLNESIDKYSALFEQAANSIILYDIDTRLPVEFNDRAHEDLGYTRDEFKFLPLEDYDLRSPEDIQTNFESILRNGKGAIETIHKCRDGETRYIIFTARAIYLQGKHYILAILNDVTGLKKAERERSRLEQQLRQSQKMEAIGTLAGGIAHDFNNILAIILGYAELALLDIPDTMEQTRKNISQLTLAVQRAQKLVRQILTFSRQEDQKMEPTQLNPVIKETLFLLRSTIPKTIDIEQHISEEPLMIMANTIQLHQVIMNLCANASHAMEEKPGVLTVSVDRFELPDDLVIPEPHVKGTPYARLVVRDTGKGIPPELIEQVFDPYFTTKGVGKGTGLGLAIVHGIIKNYNGYITINSRVGEGTTITVFIPLLQRSE
ncbi:MAG: two-component system sensor histidine kinase NtrB [Candidatus Omnitrophota bacterium]